jgi:hypothetical protein
MSDRRGAERGNETRALIERQISVGVVIRLFEKMRGVPQLYRDKLPWREKRKSRKKKRKRLRLKGVRSRRGRRRKEPDESRRYIRTEQKHLHRTTIQ